MAGQEIRVIHEVAAHEVVLVADACATARRQQQSRVLDAAAGQHDSPGPHGHTAPAERRHANAGGAVTGAIDVDDVGIQVHIDVSGSSAQPWPPPQTSR